ncbi:unnamed protein product [Nippostrongylus brasiliensis]|uniref:Dachshund homolog 1-like n=1 Tax=Nippostrongylus brasiliensis TaxID=27835 RepID=A0A0N4YCQ3_NIPBR|nr:unnamed protein product [Nippostrongylus brasiliensis]
MILKDLETADKVLKKEPDETPPSSVDASPLQVNIPPSTGRSSVTSGPSPYASPLAGGLLQGGNLPHPLHLNGDLGTLPPGLDFAAAIAAAASSSQNSALSAGAGIAIALSVDLWVMVYCGGATCAETATGAHVIAYARRRGYQAVFREIMGH